jgi:acetyl-CoA carboxylase carboxyltransferase component
VVDAVIDPTELRDDLIKRFAMAAGKDRSFATRRNPVTPA